MKRLELTVVQSVQQPHLLSLRGANGNSLKEGLVASGFKDGDKVVVLLRGELDDIVDDLAFVEKELYEMVNQD